MAITLNAARQTVLSAIVDIDYTQLANAATPGTPEAAVALPAGAIVVGGALSVVTDFDDGAAETYTMSVGTAAAQARYLAATSVDADAGTEAALTPDGVVESVPVSIAVSLIGSVGAAALTQGAVRLRVDYVIEGRSNENQG